MIWVKMKQMNSLKSKCSKDRIRTRQGINEGDEDCGTGTPERNYKDLQNIAVNQRYLKRMKNQLGND
ncbi:hypothetical protein CEXT_217241 [Caerostris extrusa]|uniref:Uncharacterized protein n=1 Tax=Caerostris extrusa TaxID=172846 RepID=A0AAV4UF99_CAEEX|nr:hypothetical protein CEXT_217241 [Caerostris extrusa]